MRSSVNITVSAGAPSGARRTCILLLETVGARIVLLVAVLVALTAPGGNAQFVRDWHAVSSEHFELISRYDPVNMGKLLQELEWVRAFFVTTFGFEPRNNRPILILIGIENRADQADAFRMGATS